MAQLSPHRKALLRSKTCWLCPCCFLEDSPWPRLSLAFSRVRTMPGTVLTTNPLPASTFTTFLQTQSKESVLFLAQLHIPANSGTNCFRSESSPLKAIVIYDFSRDELSTSPFPSCKMATTILVFEEGEIIETL